MNRLDLLRRRAGIAPVEPDNGMKEITMFTATATVTTPHASKYLQQVCKHWQHNLAVTFDPAHGTIVFPKDARGANYPGDGLVTFDADAAALIIRIDATSPEQRDGLKGAIERHVDRFAFREGALVYDWA